MKLILDIGNTRLKIAVFRKKDLEEVVTFPGPDRALIEDFITRKGPFTGCMISSVQKDNDEIIDAVYAHCRTLVLDHLVRTPLKNDYLTPESLGKDRLAASVGAYSRFPGKDILVIDAGTAITYDLVTAQGHYTGGGISPGIDMRLKALHTFTGRLPLIVRRDDVPLTGRNTEESILSGVMNGALQEVGGIIERYKEIFPGILVVFTGGDLNYFVNNLKNNIFALPNLVLEGLNEILDLND